MTITFPTSYTGYYGISASSSARTNLISVYSATREQFNVGFVNTADGTMARWVSIGY